MKTFSRRSLLTTTAAVALAGLANSPRTVRAQQQSTSDSPRVRLGMVTYNMGKDMTLPELLDLCQKTGLEGLELRTTHKHGVEVTLSAAERAEIKKRFADSPVALVGLGSAFEFHSLDEAELRKNIDGAKEYARLAADVGAPGIKVRPNGLQIEKGIAPEQTCAQIGRALREVAEFATPLGVVVRLEVHGRGSSDPKWCRRIMDEANHPGAVICWNSNPTDLDEHRKLDTAWELLAPFVKIVHINEIGQPVYPWQDLFNKLRAVNYDGFCLAEIQYNTEPERFMQYYRTLFDFYTA